MGWLAERSRAAQPSARTVAGGAQRRSRSACPTRRTDDPLATLARPDRGNDFGLCAQPRLPRRRQGHAEASGAVHRRRASAAEVKVFVDTAPVMEKPLAARAGLGWQGKHTNLVSRAHGSWLFLGEIYTTLDIAARRAARRPLRQLHALPATSARPTPFPAPYRLDATRCISYLTIEHAGPIPHGTAAADGQPHLWLRRLPGGLPVEQVCPRHAARRSCAPRDDLTAPLPGGARGAGRCRLPRDVRRLAGQAHRPRPVRAQRADRHRQFRRSVLAPTWSACERTPIRWWRKPPIGPASGFTRPTRPARSWISVITRQARGVSAHRTVALQRTHLPFELIADKLCGRGGEIARERRRMLVVIGEDIVTQKDLVGRLNAPPPHR